ncbi:MAG: hypothetical protein DRH90_20455 [Deltaproteobacteria bacterium]|nr:MAG: hypothetical protein DRH90_20455 [Deltaproteobacteria bacterium]RLC10935.1 MAG: hypothetical protein DRI24_19555 [Deltaproteobacteria bacterium]
MKMMKYAQILIGILFCLLVQQDIYAQTLYTWKDTTGTIHISQQKPSANQPLIDRRHYAVRLASKPAIETSSSADIGEDAVLTATRQAKLARKHAETSRRMAEDAILEANQVKNETDVFLEPWRNKKQVRKNILLQIESRIQKANQLIAKAEHLIDSANEAEQKAQAAEKEARRTQDKFFEAYREIITN